MNNPPPAHKPKPLTGELVIDQPSHDSNQRLEKMTQELARHSGMASLLQPKEKRQIARKLRSDHEQTVVDNAIYCLRADARTRLVETEFAFEQQRTQILATHNKRMGDLKQESLRLASKALADVVQSEQTGRDELAQCDMLEEDRAMLEQYYKQRSANAMQVIATSHGVRLQSAQSQMPDKQDE